MLTCRLVKMRIAAPACIAIFETKSELLILDSSIGPWMVCNLSNFYDLCMKLKDYCIRNARLENQ